MARRRFVQFPPESELKSILLDGRWIANGGAQLDAGQAISVAVAGDDDKDRRCNVQHERKVRQPADKSPWNAGQRNKAKAEAKANAAGASQVLPAGVEKQLERTWICVWMWIRQDQQQMYQAINMIQLSHNSSATRRG